MPSAPVARATAVSSGSSMFASRRIAHAVGGRRRPFAARRDARPGRCRASCCRASAAPSIVRRRIDDQLARRAVDDHDVAGHDARLASCRPTTAGTRANARGSRCDTCGCRRRSRSRGPASSRPARPPTASARRRSSTHGASSSRSRSRAATLPWRRFMRSRPTTSATSPLRSRRYGSSTSSNTRSISSNACCTAHSALTRSSRTSGRRAADQHRVVEHQQLRVEERREVRAGPSRCARGCRSSCSRDRSRGSLEPRDLALDPLGRDRKRGRPAPRCDEQHGASRRDARRHADAVQALHVSSPKSGLDQRAQRVDAPRVRPARRR